MARIRSIKPGFWTDEKVDKLSAEAALFFIGLWNFCDDYGYFNTSPAGLRLKMPRYTARSVQGMLSKLVEVGLVVVNQSLGVGLVTGWKHQKIDRPQASEWKDKEIQWDTVSDSTNGRERSTQGEDRIGRDRIGKDSGEGTSRVPNGLAPIVTKSDPKPISKKPEPDVRDVIAHYCDSWRELYRTDGSPDITGKSAGIFKNLVKDLGVDRVKKLISAYLRMPDPWCVQRRHDPATLVANLTQVTHFAETGKLISRTETQRLDRTVAAQNTLEQLRAGNV